MNPVDQSYVRQRDGYRGYYLANKSRIIAQHREYKKLNRSKVNTMASNWAKNNPDKIKSHYSKQKDWFFKRNLKKYNMTPESYEAMMVTQGRVCASCGRVNRDGRRLAVDHRHSDGVVRGLLCDGCNLGIGHFDESIDRLKLAIKYLETHND